MVLPDDVHPGLQPHDFCRIVTDPIANGMPPHIAQITCGHWDINTTMGYHSVHPHDAIEAHRAFIAHACGRQREPCLGFAGE
ncbi:hypothetical protein [Streptomyces avermitilis]|uniref:hypothetical protein n=1 Tax=Streptomyces avermitilis TaxID=33903 RepID=UPI00340467EA